MSSNRLERGYLKFDKCHADKPCIQYGLDACRISYMEMNSLNYAVTRILFKIVCSDSNDIQQCYQFHFNFPDISELITSTDTHYVMKFSVTL